MEIIKYLLVGATGLIIIGLVIFGAKYLLSENNDTTSLMAQGADLSKETVQITSNTVSSILEVNKEMNQTFLTEVPVSIANAVQGALEIHLTRYHEQIKNAIVTLTEKMSENNHNISTIL